MAGVFVAARAIEGASRSAPRHRGLLLDGLRSSGTHARPRAVMTTVMPEDDQERDDDTAAALQAEGLRRYSLIRGLLQDEHRSLPAAEMQAAARTLGVSQTTLYRLVRLYRQHGTVEALHRAREADPKAAGCYPDASRQSSAR